MGAVLLRELGEVDPGGMSETEGLGDGERAVYELPLRREQLDPHAPPGQLVKGE
jgi:hypothetical protein